MTSPRAGSRISAVSTARRSTLEYNAVGTVELARAFEAAGEGADLQPASLGEPPAAEMPPDQVLGVAHGLAVADYDEPRAWRDPPFGRELPREGDRHGTNNTG